MPSHFGPHLISHKYLAAVFAVLFLFSWNTGQLSAQDATKREALTLVTSSGEHKFNVEIAATRDQHSRGLMFRRSMDPAHGMLFVYKDVQYVSMWMRNTYITLDMIFIRADGKVHRIEKSTEPLSERVIESGDKVLGVLEVKGGTASRINLKPGNVIRHSLFKSTKN